MPTDILLLNITLLLKRIVWYKPDTLGSLKNLVLVVVKKSPSTLS